MSRMLTGRDALKRLDMTIADARRAVNDAIEASEASESRRAEVARQQAEAYGLLADIRIDLIDEMGNRSSLSDLDKSVSALLAKHDAYVEQTLHIVDTLASELADLEQQRADKAAALDHGIEAYEARVAEIKTDLVTSKTYQALALAAEQASAVTVRAEQKLDLSKSDRDEKGAPYEADPLFMYLWKRRFRTADYKASGLTRMLDGWVARLCGYDKAHLNYDRLTELPKRIEEHLEVCREEEADAIADLEAGEQEALLVGGAEDLRDAANAIRAELAALDAEIETKEANHLEIVETHSEAKEGNIGPAREARRLLESRLKKASFPDLRILVAETVTTDDDRVVDALVQLRKEEMGLELQARDLAQLPERRRRDLGELENLRRNFKVKSYDSAYAQFRRSDIDSVLAMIMSGRMDAGDAIRNLSRVIRRREPRTERGFGGRSRDRTLGLPNVLGDIAIEVLKEVGRSGRRGGSPFDFDFDLGDMPRPRRRSGGGSRSPRRKSTRSKSRSIKSSNKRGGFKSRGGF